MPVVSVAQLPDHHHMDKANCLKHSKLTNRKWLAIVGFQLALAFKAWIDCHELDTSVVNLMQGYVQTTPGESL